MSTVMSPIPSRDFDEEKLKAARRALDAKAQAYLAKARKDSAEALSLELTVAVQKRAEIAEALSNRNQCYMPFVVPILEQTVADCMDTLIMWSRIYPGRSMDIMLNSPGGSTIHGINMYDGIKGLISKGHIITITVNGIAASMAAIVLQAASKRVMGKESWLLLHEASFGVNGKIGEVEDLTGWVNRVEERFIHILVERSQGRLTRTKIRSGLRRKDWWLSSDECLEFGLVDEVI